MPVKTKSKLSISPLIDKSKLKAAFKQARGIWKHKREKINKEYRTIRKEWN